MLERISIITFIVKVLEASAKFQVKKSKYNEKL